MEENKEWENIEKYWVRMEEYRYKWKENNEWLSKEMKREKIEKNDRKKERKSICISKKENALK